ncbi:SagB/ThcOx family dehydrogenase [bacterium]|nr:SagB/ThcOx family dehydrogenase [bacterium]
MGIQRFSALTLLLLLTGSGLLAQEAGPMQIPAPQTGGGLPLMQALGLRKSTRQFSADTIPVQVLSNLLWAACGVNRPGENKRTAPSARNMQEVHVYVSMEKGLFLYDAPSHSLIPVLSDDIRAATGMQDFVAQAPLNLVYVADVNTDSTVSEADRMFYPATDTGFISQNVYLFCASEGLATVVRGMVNRPALAARMGLRPDQRIILAQSVGTFAK